MRRRPTTYTTVVEAFGESFAVFLLQLEVAFYDGHIARFDETTSDVVVLRPRVVTKRVKSFNPTARLQLLEPLEKDRLPGFVGPNEDGLLVFERAGAHAEAMMDLRDAGFEFITYERKPCPKSSMGIIHRHYPAAKEAVSRVTALGFENP